MVARDFFEVLISYEFFSMTVLKVVRKSIGERVKCAGFLTNAAVSEKKRVKTWPIEIALRVTPPLKVHVLSR